VPIASTCGLEFLPLVLLLLTLAMAPEAGLGEVQTLGSPGLVMPTAADLKGPAARLPSRLLAGITCHGFLSQLAAAGIPGAWMGAIALNGLALLAGVAFAERTAVPRLALGGA